jgi:hypothetical protein
MIGYQKSSGSAKIIDFLAVEVENSTFELDASWI